MDFEAKPDARELAALEKSLETFFERTKAAAPRGKHAADAPPCAKPVTFRLFKTPIKTPAKMTAKTAKDSAKDSAREPIRESVRCLERLGKSDLAKLSAITDRLSIASKPKGE